MNKLGQKRPGFHPHWNKIVDGVSVCQLCEKPESEQPDEPEHCKGTPGTPMKDLPLDWHEKTTTIAWEGGKESEKTAGAY